ncbi:uncharacterized protein PpBr36_05740 [Pyricularia pennisetigena]|uniref:uncharacterized protein n=1 Tax=Pyricularia pennisetigena TaxID=1578925 RepID=UPI001150AA2B|nr:uncharacterized protein PpBr36_05740 [Pyricularia pennisetigena]TLS22653.1 hypothetical protein PpBr36_05740 [Pyricularia pennisetigena]
MSSTKALIVAALIAYVEARFGQEQIPVAAVQALGSFGSPGQAATLSGSVPGVLLAAAKACDKVKLADKIVEELGNDPAVISAAKGLLVAEMNFNPFAVKTNKICDDASLPATAELRGVIPKVDPASDPSGIQNSNAEKSVNTPFNADGLSIAAISQAQGFSNFILGDSGTLASGGGAANNSSSASGGAANNSGGAKKDNQQKSKQQNSCNSEQKDQQNKQQNDGQTNNNLGKSNQGNNQGNNNGGAASGGAATNGTASGAADFGKCTPTIDLKGGRGNRAATELTFLPTDALVAQGQQEALNPNIITNRVCDQLTNVCGANAAAKALCLEAKAKVQAAGTKDQSTVDLFNSALGF